MDADLRGIEHSDAEDVAIPRRTGAHDLGEERKADAHQLAGLAALERVLAFLLLFAQLLVPDRLHRFFESGLIVTGIVDPTERRCVWELLAPDEVLHPEFSRIHLELLRHDIHGALDGVGSLRNAE